MKNEVGLIGIVILVILGLYLLRKKLTPTSSVRITSTTSGMTGLVMQTCFDDNGNSYLWPVTSGPCPPPPAIQ